MTDHKYSEQELIDRYRHFQQQNLKLDLTRGKPSPEQLSLSNDLDGILQGNYQSDAGVDVRNYGGLDGLPEVKALGAQILGVRESEIIVGGNSSLSLMQHYVSFALREGAQGPESAWNRETSTPKFLCPVPGYDRHFTICENLGIEMIPVEMTDEGPNMDQVESLLAADSSIKGIWCVPKYSNPTGCTYSDEVVHRIGSLKMAGPNFKIMWDNAYAVHDLGQETVTLKNLMDVCREQGTEDQLVITGSTSKITFAGSGISFLASSESNLGFLKKQLATMTIGPDKVNQLRHLRFLKNMAGLEAHMQKHAVIMKEKFDIVLNTLEEHLGGTDIGQWTKPKGGYFVSFDTKPGLAQKVVSLAADAGVKLTPAGATFPYKKDPQDSNIRIAPSFPPVGELKQAMEIFVVCVQLASANNSN